MLIGGSRELIWRGERICKSIIAILFYLRVDNLALGWNEA